MNRLLLVRTAVASAIIVLLSIVGTAPAQAESFDEGTGLTVTPAAALFDVVLEPGRPEARLVTLENSSDRSISVHLTTELADSSSADHRFTEIALHTDTADSCTAAPLDPSRLVAFDRVAAMHQTVVAPHSSETVCVNVVLPDTGADRRDSSTVVHFRFDAMQRPTGQLPGTGWAMGRIELLALAAIILGSILALSRRRTARTADTSSPPDMNSAAPQDGSDR